MEMFGVV